MGPSTDTLIARYLRQLTVELGRSPHTVAAYRRDLGVYAAWLGDRGIDELTEVEVEGFVVALREGTATGAPLAATSVARMLSSVRGLHRFALEEGVLVEDVTRELRPPKPAMRLPKAPTVEQVALLIEAAGGDEPQRIRDRALLEFLYATGARVSEALALDVDELAPIREGAGVIRLTGKGAKQRLVPLGGYAKAAIEEYLVRVRPEFAAAARRSSPALFLGVRGARLSRQHAWLIIREAGERAGLEAQHLSPHTLRHAFATHLLQGGADVRVVQELLGHSSVATTQIYTKVTPDLLQTAYLLAHPRAT